MSARKTSSLKLVGLVKICCKLQLAIHVAERTHPNLSKQPRRILRLPFAMSESVDAIWAELQTERQHHRQDVDRLLKRSMTSKPTKKSVKAQATTAKLTKGVANITTSNACSLKTKPSDNRSQQLREAFSLQRELNRLRDEHPGVRKAAAMALEAHFLAGGTLDPEQVEGGFDELAKPLFKKFNDPVEKVREVSIRITARFIAQEEDLLRYLPYLMPAIANRIQSQWTYDEENQVFTRDQFLHDAFKRGRVYVEEEQVARIKPQEPSEEIRLLFVELLAALLNNAFRRNASSILHAYIFDVILVLASGVNDDFHDINIRSCEVLRDMSHHMVSVMKHFTVGFVRAVKHLLIHRLARVRITAIQCIQALVSCPNFEKCKGSGTEAIVDLIGHRDENVIPISAFYTGETRYNFFAKLDQDANPQVRRAFYGMIQDWLINLPDRYDHESRLMPYVLSGVSDELEETSQEAMKALALLGRRHEEERGEEVVEMKQYGVDGRNPTYNYTKILPAPFLNQRPSLGTRLYVRGRARRFLNPLLRELDNWQSPTRAHAVSLLKCVLVYCEETVTVDAHILIQTLLRTWHDTTNANHLREIADLVGRFVAPQTYLPILLSRIRGDSDVVGQVVTPQAVAVAIDVLVCLMGGTLDRVLLPHVQEIVSVCTSNAILDFDTPDVKVSLSTLTLYVSHLLQRRGSDAVSAYFLEHGRLTNLDRLHRQLFEASLLLMHGSPKASNRANEALDILQEIGQFNTREELFDGYFDGTFAHISEDLRKIPQVEWTSKSPEMIIMTDLFETCSMAKLRQGIPQLRCFLQLYQSAKSDEDGEGDHVPMAKFSEGEAGWLSMFQPAITRLTVDECPEAQSLLELYQALALASADADAA